jgi:glycosyltransferase involved in cell wall biosynthesis
MYVALIGSARFPIAEPFAGGLEAHVWALARGLRERGHRVAVFAAPGSDPCLGVEEMELRRPRLSDAARTDVSMGASDWIDEHHAYLDLMLRLGRRTAGYDVVHNNSLHHLPIAMAATLPLPMLTTLHTPPTPWLESAIQVHEPCPVAFAAVSRHTARSWRHAVPDASVVPNGVDVTRWRPGPGGGPLVWYGRIAPEKGTHLAIEAALAAGEDLLVAGPVVDRRYWKDEVEPRLRPPQIRHLGHLGRRDLARLVGAASAVLVTPSWEEPYGLVVAESLACGTPVCGFARGALPELLDSSCGILVEPGDVDALAKSIPAARRVSRAAARRHAERNCSLERMVDGYEELYAALAGAAG